jgi:hypothetical protein
MSAFPEQAAATTTRPWYSPYLVAWSALTLIATAIAIPNLVVCAGGHFGTWNLPVTGALAVSAWLPFLVRVRQGVFARVVVRAAVLAATLLLGKNVLDILWAHPV